jgi:hypothetical protein
MFLIIGICKVPNGYCPSRLSSDIDDSSMALEAANHLHTPLYSVDSLFPITEPCKTCAIPADWTSPLSCQWLHETSTENIETQTLLLAVLVSTWLRTFLDENSQIMIPSNKSLEERADLRMKIENSVLVVKKSNPEAVAMYECCRWASMILLAVEKLCIPIHLAAKQVRIRPKLVRRLRMTDLSSLWGNRKGLLLWVTITCQFSTAGQCFPLLCTTILARMTQEIAMSDCCSDIAIKPLKRLKTFESLCCSPARTI